MDIANGVVLVVEDDPDDVFFIERAFASAKIEQAIQVASDGEQAVQYLGGKGQFSDRKKYPVPRLVLLDLKLPKKPGLEVLRWMKHARMAGIPVIVFTSSSSPEDVKAAYEAGAASYVVKPLNLDERRQFACLLKSYWLEKNITPDTLQC